jgi:uncharacterized protein
LQDAANKTAQSQPAGRQEKSTVEKILDSPVARQVERTAASVITRSLLGALGLGGRSSSKKSTGWF